MESGVGDIDLQRLGDDSRRRTLEEPPEGESQPYLKMLAVYLSGEAARYLTFTGPFLGEPLKACFCRRADGPHTNDRRSQAAMKSGCVWKN